MDALEVRAVAKDIRISPQKVRRVIDVVRGMTVNDALSQLEFLPHGASGPVRKVIRSAAANAEENLGLSRDDMFVATIFADEAQTRRWRRFGARGRFKPILHRGSHITVILRERD